MRLAGQICIVTGAASGIGEACARRFVAEGAKVIIADIQADKAAQVASDLGVTALARFCDVTDREQVDALVAEAVERFGRLDVMVNNVGFTTPGFLADLSDSEWHRVLNGCLSTAFYGLRAALRPMRAQGSGSIINMGSAAGLGGAPGLGVYGAAKAGVIAMTQTAAIENFKAGVRVNCILPNAATAPLLADFAKHPAGKQAIERIEAYGRFGRPDEIAPALVFLASNEAAFVNGQILSVDGGLASRVASIDAKIE
jgi:NAD(P)-dependent dehydrogenase (short-subunit alcohol dehydrogenase family)